MSVVTDKVFCKGQDFADPFPPTAVNTGVIQGLALVAWLRPPQGNTAVFPFPNTMTLRSKIKTVGFAAPTALERVGGTSHVRAKT